MPKTSTKGLEFYNLSTEWKHGMPQWPSKANMNIKIREFHAKDGLQTLEYEGIMHRGTHMDAPIHVLENTPFITDYETWRFFGTGVVVSIPKDKWEVITAEDDLIELNFRSYDDHAGLDEIEVWNREDDKRASWQSDEYRQRKAAPELLSALKLILPHYVDFLRGAGADLEECEGYQRAKAAVANAAPKTN